MQSREVGQPPRKLTKYLSTNQIGMEQQRGGSALNLNEEIVRNKSMKSLGGGAQ